MLRFPRVFIVIVIVISFCFGAVNNIYADNEGQRVLFKINSEYDELDRSSISATLRYVSNKAYFYIEDTYWDNLPSSQQASILNSVVSLASEFDQHIYPQETSFWGSEANPGVDNDSRITILLHNLKSGFGGYFNSINSYSRVQAKDSNEREMIFLNIKSVSDSLAKVYLGHEFQHLISNNQKELERNIQEFVWLNESRSEYTSSLLGYDSPFSRSNLDRRLRLFIQNPSNSLTQWPNTAADYGIATIFAEYLAGRYGPEILSDTLHSSGSGIASINGYLSSKGYAERFGDIFSDWMVASYLNKLGDLKYGYANPNLQGLHVPIQYQEMLRDGTIAIDTNTVRQWQPIWYEFLVSSPSRALKLELQSGANTLFRIPIVISYTDGTTEVDNFSFRGSKTLYIIASKTNGGSRRQIQKVALAITAEGNLPESTTEDVGFPLAVTSSLLDEMKAEEISQIDNTSTINIGAGGLQDGMLIKRIGQESEVYVIEGKYKRYLRPEIIALYGHLIGVQPIEVSDDIFQSYVTANYIRDVNQKQIYAVWPDGTKHWLNMSGSYFSSSGRDWGSIFIVNDAEFNKYLTGSIITK